jgi:hypothetical protein
VAQDAVGPAPATAYQSPLAPLERKPGAAVAFTALTASPWENTFNGQNRHGIAFRAAALTAKAA